MAKKKIPAKQTIRIPVCVTEDGKIGAAYSPNKSRARSVSVREKRHAECLVCDAEEASGKDGWSYPSTTPYFEIQWVEVTIKTPVKPPSKTIKGKVKKIDKSTEKKAPKKRKVGRG